MTTQTELRGLLEDAAYAMGFTAWCFDDDAFCVSTEPDVSDPDDIYYVGWQPDLNSADGAEMEAELYIGIYWGFAEAEACSTLTSGFYPKKREWYSDHATKQSARRMASLRVAAEIGKAKREQEAA